MKELDNKRISLPEDLPVLTSNSMQKFLCSFLPQSVLQHTNTHLFLKNWRAVLPQVAVRGLSRRKKQQTSPKF